jgi:hypothetical protein
LCCSCFLFLFGWRTVPRKRFLTSKFGSFDEYRNQALTLVGVESVNDAVLNVALALAAKDQALALAAKDQDLALKDKDHKFAMKSQEAYYSSLLAELSQRELLGTFFKQVVSAFSNNGPFNAEVFQNLEPEKNQIQNLLKVSFPDIKGGLVARQSIKDKQTWQINFQRVTNYLFGIQFQKKEFAETEKPRYWKVKKLKINTFFLFLLCIWIHFFLCDHST